jgi:hypothetical protein
MEIGVQVPLTSGDPGECIRAAKANMRRVKQLLTQPSEENAEESAALLREVEIQLGYAVAVFKTRGSARSVELQAALESLQGEIAVLAQFFAQADQLLSGWLHALSSRHSGYTTGGKAAPLVLLKKVSVEG